MDPVKGSFDPQGSQQGENHWFRVFFESSLFPYDLYMGATHFTNSEILKLLTVPQKQLSVSSSLLILASYSLGFCYSWHTWFGSSILISTHFYKYATVFVCIMIFNLQSFLSATRFLIFIFKLVVPLSQASLQ